MIESSHKSFEENVAEKYQAMQAAYKREPNNETLSKLAATIVTGEESRAYFLAFLHLFCEMQKPPKPWWRFW